MTITPFVRPLSLGTLAEHPGLSDSILFQLNGLVVVFVALSAIWGLMEVTGRFFRRRAAAPARIAVPPEPAAPPEQTSPPPVSASPASARSTSRPEPAGASAEVTAVIAASVATVIGGRFQIHAVTLAGDPLDWAREGRRQIFASHNYR